MRCAVWGSPIAHSLSPVLHRAAYAALGLEKWRYVRREIDETGFAPAIAGLDGSWRGLSLTMPLKEVAASVASSVSAAASETGAINTLVRDGGGWAAHNTDVHGMDAALQEAGCTRPRTAIVVGSGATARSAIRALEGLGARSVTLMVRREARAETVAQARRAGLAVDVVAIGAWRPTDVIINTVPPDALTGVESLPSSGREGGPGVLLDVVYGDGETPLQVAAGHRGWVVVDGTAMLLHQAGEQVRLMTGRVARLEQMRAALVAARS